MGETFPVPYPAGKPIVQLSPVHLVSAMTPFVDPGAPSPECWPVMLQASGPYAISIRMHAPPCFIGAPCLPKTDKDPVCNVKLRDAIFLGK